MDPASKLDYNVLLNVHERTDKDKKVLEANTDLLSVDWVGWNMRAVSLKVSSPQFSMAPM